MNKAKKYKIAESILDLFQDKEQPALIATKAGDKDICVIWLKDQIYACTAKCPHASGKMADGFIDALGNIVCPLHRYKFNPNNGLNTTGEGYFLKTFEIEENEDGVFVIY